MRIRTVFVITLFCFAVTPVMGQVGPDVTVSNMGSIATNGTLGGITAYSLSTTSCNRGDMVAIWEDNNNQHPVIAGNIYRVSSAGLVEQLGMSWLKHGFCAVNEGSCGSCQSTPCDTLGLGCADTYGTGLNGSQGNLGPRSDVNASTGFFNYPFPTQGSTGNAIFKRCQVHASDVDPSANGGAQYFGVVQYITSDETAWGNMHNNNSYRRLNVGSATGGGWNFSYTGGTIEEGDPIIAWQALATGVTREVIDTPETAGLGQLIVGTRTEDLGGGNYRYQYAVFNNNSHRSARSLSIPVPSGLLLTNVYFGDVDYHSGEPYDGTDWAPVQGGADVTWSTDTFATDADANALRWGTTYSFSFEAAAPPVATTGTIGLFRDGPGGNSVTFSAMGPSGDFTAPVSNLNCFYSADEAQLSWTNGEAYDSVDITRDGALLATLAGSATSYSDPTVNPGLHTYGVSGVVGAAPSGALTCDIDVPVPPPLGFDFIAADTLGSYDEGTGVGSFQVAITVDEDPANDNYPNAIHGVSMSLSNDASLITPVAAAPGSAVAGMNGGSGPEFFAPAYYADGVTLGIYFDFQGLEPLLATTAQELAVVDYDTNAPNLAGDADGEVTNLVWQGGIGDVPVPNTVLLDNSGEADPTFVSGTVTLTPILGPPEFVRGDCNLDTQMDISDPIQLLDGLFLAGNIACADGCDADDDGALGLTDVFLLLDYIVGIGAAPAAPFPGCGEDASGDGLDCLSPVCP